MTIDFFKTAANLKKVKRQGWIDKLSLEHPESVADHSYSMAIMGMILSDIGNCDSEKILKMILLHDLAESEIGDYTPGQITSEEKRKLEDETFYKISENLPADIKSQYQKIWDEYQENKSYESKLVHQIDRLEMVLQATIYENDGHSKENLSSFIESAKQGITDLKLKELFRKILENN